MAYFTSVCGVILNMEVVASVRLWEDGEEAYLQVSFNCDKEGASYFLKDAEKARKEWAEFCESLKAANQTLAKLMSEFESESSGDVTFRPRMSRWEEMDARMRKRAKRNE